MNFSADSVSMNLYGSTALGEDTPDEHEFITAARFVLTGDSRARGPLASLNPGMSADDMQKVLTSLAERGNSTRPVAARLQSRPANVARLVAEPQSVTVQAARRGVVYKFVERPQQTTRPRIMRMKTAETAAVNEEITRLLQVCEAIELAPDHDCDKALGPTASRFEREPFPLGPWPREDEVPVFNTQQEVLLYDNRMQRGYLHRRQTGKPLRDFESGVFVVGKSDGGFRLCTDYRKLNVWSGRSKFQMEGIQQVAELIQPGDFATLVDLKDCYLTLGLHPCHRKYCRFRSPDGTRYQWRTVSFGTAEAPQICTKILKPIVRILKSLNIRCLIYIDDLIILDQSMERCARAMGVAIMLLQQECGLQLKLSKGQLTPQQVFVMLGFEWDSRTMMVRVPVKRLKGVQRTAVRLLRAHPTVMTRDLGRFVGQAVACQRGIKPAKRRLLYIQHALSRAVRSGGWNGTTTLDSKVREALQWWTSEEVWWVNGHSVVPPLKPIQLQLRTDAATGNVGYGGVLTYGTKTFSTRGYLTATEQLDVWINEFEFQGFVNTLKALLPLAVPDRKLWPQVHISAELDNTTAIKYGEVAVSRSLNMSKKGADFFDWKESHGLSVSLRHLAGVLNTEADELSRVASSHIDWQLHRWLFLRVTKYLRVRVKMDLFAAAGNCQVPRFFSFHHDHRAVGTDAFQFDWRGRGTLYAYPPPILIGRVLQKMRSEEVPQLLLVAPVWVSQHWWPTLVEMMRSPPVLLPNHAWITLDPMGNDTWPCRWPLAVWNLSGSSRLAKQSRAKLWSTGGGCRRTAIHDSMTVLLRSSNGGGSVPTPMWNSVLQTYGLV